MKKIQLVLETGEVFWGNSLGWDIDENGVMGELVFNTGMTGYQEVFTDPSYCDQIVVMTYPLIGNYGVNINDYESLTPSLKAIVVKESCETPDNWRSQKSLNQFLKDHKMVAITGIDTRKLTKIIRSQGSMKAKLVNPALRNSCDLLKHSLATDQIARVSVKTPHHYPSLAQECPEATSEKDSSRHNIRIVIMDFGYKKSILTSLLHRGCEVLVVPYNISFEDIQKFKPDGILLSNGPGDPKSIPQVLPVIQKLQQVYPLFAICMGHQLFALANGADTEKMKFGHRGNNHPVKDFANDRVYITAQNHGYAVSIESIESTPLEITQVNINDNSIEGLRHKSFNAFSVQYHPEANPGPSDTNFLFDQFILQIKNSLYSRERTPCQ